MGDGFAESTIHFMRAFRPAIQDAEVMALVDAAFDYRPRRPYRERYNERLWYWAEYARDYDGQATVI